MTLSPTPPWSMLFSHTRAENIQLNFSIFCFLGKGRGGIFDCQCFEELYLETRLSDVHFPSHYCSIKGVQAPSGLACECSFASPFTVYFLGGEK